MKLRGEGREELWGREEMRDGGEEREGDEMRVAFLNQKGSNPESDRITDRN